MILMPLLTVSATLPLTFAPIRYHAAFQKSEKNTTPPRTLTHNHTHYLINKHNYGRFNMIGRERANRALIGCDSQ